MPERLAVIGLGYVGLPVAVALAEAGGDVIGLDIGQRRVAELLAGDDRTGEVDAVRLRACGLPVTGDAGRLTDRSFFIVTVPTPIDGDRQPDLRPLDRACRTVGAALAEGGIVVFESTVFPGATEEFCVPILEQVSGLRLGSDFAVGYSPERINPGDKAHRLETITKVISASSPEALERVRAVYGRIVPAGLFEATSIRVAEAAKVIENTQRDLNIALMNELALIFERLGLRTADVLAAARTKWNFLPFTPGLVGGHCIGVDPYYLTARAERAGYHPEVILAGRRINDGMGAFVAQKLVKLLIAADVPVKRAKVGILGLTFKENVPDLRNSKVPDIVKELGQFGIEALVHDPLADAEEARLEYGLDLVPVERLTSLDAVVLAVPHKAFLDGPAESGITRMVSRRGIVIDVRSVIDPACLAEGLSYWSL